MRVAESQPFDRMPIPGVHGKYGGHAVHRQMVLYIAWMRRDNSHGISVLDPVQRRVVMTAAGDPHVAVIVVDPASRVAHGPRLWLHLVLSGGRKNSAPKHRAHLARNAGVEGIKVGVLRRRTRGRRWSNKADVPCRC